MSVNIIIKKGISAFNSGCGLFYMLEHYRLADKAFVLMYHRVLSRDSSHDIYVQPGMFVTDKTFDRHISFLREKYQILSLEKLIEKKSQNENLSGCCAITFDDGWRDNYTDAFPVLKKYQVPVTIFLATAFIGTNSLFWPEEICWHLEQHSLVDATANKSFPVLKFYNEIEKYASDNRDMFLNKVIEYLKVYSPDERNAVLEYFRGMGTLQQDFTRQMLSWEEADEMRKSGLIEFGAHTARHEILDQLPISKVRTEISQSKKDIEQRLGVTVTTFAYPNGNYNEDVVKILDEGDFVGAVTTRKGFMGKHTPMMEIPRIGVHEDISCTIPMFQGRILMEKF